MRGLLVQAALYMLRLRQPQTLHLRTWAERIASRRGNKTHRANGTGVAGEG